MELKLLGIDFESNGDDPKKCLVTEVGAVMMKYDTDTKTLHSGETYNTLVYHPDYPPQPKHIVDITGITDVMLKEQGILPEKAFTHLVEFMKPAQYVFAHNKVFDQTVFESTCNNLKILFPKKSWICTYQEVPYPEKYTCKKLAHLAYDHGIKLDHRSLHRAVDDVTLLFDLISTKYDIEEIIKYAAEPWLYVKANIVGPWVDNGVQKDQATKLGFGWEKCRGTSEPVFPKSWVLRMKQSKFKDFRAPFKTEILNDSSQNT